jgi:hypothetical protein
MNCELEESKKRNIKNRREFVKFYADWIKKTKNEVWSKQQADFINSLLRNANQDIELFKKTHPEDFKK